MFSSFSRSVVARRAVVGSVRSLSDAASHKPVVDLHGLSARYANATYVAASKAGMLDQVEAELGELPVLNCHVYSRDERIRL